MKILTITAPIANGLAWLSEARDDTSEAFIVSTSVSGNEEFDMSPARVASERRESQAEMFAEYPSGLVWISGRKSE